MGVPVTAPVASPTFVRVAPRSASGRRRRGTRAGRVRRPGGAARGRLRAGPTGELTRRDQQLWRPTWKGQTREGVVRAQEYEK